MPIMIINPTSSAVANDKKTPVSSNQVKNNEFSSILNSSVNSRKTTSLDTIFNEASQKYNVPVNLLKAVAKAESNFKATAKSSCGAMGIMQLMPSTAKSLGVSNPYDARQNIMGGAKYLGQLLNRFDGNTKLAVAAYNAGPGSVLKYSGVPPYKETQNYVVKVMGYMGKQLDTGSIVEKNNSTVSTSSNESMSQNSQKSVQAPTDYLADSELSGKEYANLMNIYQYQLQINLLSDIGSDSDINKKSNIFG